jgi:uncharacterized protein YeaO (DUF488 family)
MIQLKRAYDPVEDGDGIRILVDRLWPRGVSREELDLDHWMKELAPSDNLRKWFDHDPDKFEEFKQRYQEELHRDNQVDQLISICQNYETVTLIYAAKDRTHNNAVVLKTFLDQEILD